MELKQKIVPYTQGLASNLLPTFVIGKELSTDDGAKSYKAVMECGKKVHMKVRVKIIN